MVCCGGGGTGGEEWGASWGETGEVEGWYGFAEVEVGFGRERISWGGFVGLTEGVDPGFIIRVWTGLGKWALGII